MDLFSLSIGFKYFSIQGILINRPLLLENLQSEFNTTYIVHDTYSGFLFSSSASMYQLKHDNKRLQIKIAIHASIYI